MGLTATEGKIIDAARVETKRSHMKTVKHEDDDLSPRKEEETEYT